MLLQTTEKTFYYTTDGLPKTFKWSLTSLNYRIEYFFFENDKPISLKQHYKINELTDNGHRLNQSTTEWKKLNL